MGRFPWLMRCLSWLTLFVFGLGPVLWFFFRLATGEPTPGEGALWLGLSVISCLVFVISQVSMNTTEFGLTDERLVYKSGLISRHTNEIPLQSLENVNLHQSIFSRLFGYGRIEVNGSGGSSVISHAVQNPIALRAAISEALSALEHPSRDSHNHSSIDHRHNGDRDA